MMTSKAVKGIAFTIIISVMLGVFFAWRWSSSALIPLLASFGGMIVFLGLWIEKEAEDEDKKEHLSNLIGDARILKLKSEIGWWVLMGGIVIEALVAGGLAMHEVWAARKIESTIARNDPTNGPIRTVEAHALLIMEKPVEAWNRNSGMKCAWLRLYHVEGVGSERKFFGIDLTSEEFRPHTNFVGGQKFSFDLSLIPDEPRFGAGVFPKNGMSAAEMVKILDAFELSLSFFPAVAEVSTGYVSIRINAAIEKYIPIPRQQAHLGRMVGDLTPSPDAAHKK